MRRRLLAAGLLVGIVAAAGVVFLRMDRGGAANRPSTMANPALVEAKLLEGGLPPELAKTFSAVTTELVSGGPGRAHFVQEVPALKLRQDVLVAIQPDQQLDITRLRRLPSGAGPGFYLLHYSLRAVPGGYQRYTAVFLPYDSIEPAALQHLGLQRRASVGSTHPIALGVAPTEPGITVASVTTTTASGLGDTAGGQGYSPPTVLDSKAGSPSNPPEVWSDGSTGPTPEQQLAWANEQARINANSEAYEASRNGAAERARMMAEQEARATAEWESFQRNIEEAGRQEAAARANQSPAGPAACGGSSAASNAIPNLLQALGAASVVLEARSQFQSTAADQAAGNRQIDAFEAAARGNSGNATADALAQRAQTEDPLGTQKMAEQAAAAKEDLAVNTAVRVLNTALGAAATLLLGPAAPVAAAVAGVATAANDANLRDAHNANMSGLEHGSGQLTQRALDVIRNAQNPALTNTLEGVTGFNNVPRVDDGARCEPPTDADPGAGQALIVVNATESDGRTITFRSIVHLTDVLPGTPPGVTLRGRDFRGKSTGPYREQFVSDQCGFTITWTGEVDVSVVARANDSRVPAGEVQVGIEGPVTQAGEWPGKECLDGYYYAPNRPLPARGLGYSCRFDNVDFTHAAIYRSPPPAETPNPYVCVLNIGPLIPPTPTPAPRTP